MASVNAGSAGAAFTPEQEKILSKVMWRIVPFLLLCYIVAYLDRVNVGIASLTMNHDLGISPSEFGWSAGLFFFGYFLAEVPSNLALQAIGARKWIARILITWGLISAATAFVAGPVSFGVMRFLLGLGEAGFTPGVFLYFTYWFPARIRGTATAAFLLGIPIANIIGAPISSSLLTLDGVGGLHGWQWLLILEGLPATVLGFVCFFTLTDKPGQAKWLSPDERRWLAEVLAAEREAIATKHPSRLRDAFINWRVLACAAVNFCAIIGSVGLGLWMPQIIKGLGFGVVAVGFVAAVPYICGAIAMMLWARLSDKGGERSWFVASALLMGAASLIVCGYATSSALVSIVALCGAVVGIMCYQSTFWPIPSSFLTGSAAAGGLAMIVSIGNLGGFVGPYLIGVIKQATDSFSWALLSVAAFLVLAAILIRVVGVSLQRQAGSADDRTRPIAPPLERNLMMSEQKQFRLGLVGYGEIGSTLGKGLRGAGLQQIFCYDKYAFDGPYADLIQSRAKAAGVTLVRSNKELADAAELIFSVTPGSASLESATAFASVLDGRHTFLDFASATPKVKFGVAERLAKTDATLGDGSIMGTPKHGYAMHMMSSGPAGQRVVDLLVPWGMSIEFVGDKLGTASGIKILRSVLIKGIEALIDETLLAARSYGLDETVLASASKTLTRPFMDTVESLTPSGVIHAKRRTEEVEMAAEAVEDAGIEPLMARATVARLRWKENLGLKEHFKGVVPENYKIAIDAIVAKMQAGAKAAE